jgi:hypothetical protein
VSTELEVSRLIARLDTERVRLRDRKHDGAAVLAVELDSLAERLELLADRARSLSVAFDAKAAEELTEETAHA